LAILNSQCHRTVGTRLSDRHWNLAADKKGCSVVIAGAQISLREDLSVAPRRLCVDERQDILSSKVSEKGGETCRRRKNDIARRFVENIVGVENPRPGAGVPILVAVQRVHAKFV